jgi:hypothetical protein
MLRPGTGALRQGQFPRHFEMDERAKTENLGRRAVEKVYAGFDQPNHC